MRKTATIKVSRRVVPVNVAVKKPANNVYFRSHPHPDMSLDASILIGGDGSDDFYFVTPSMLNHHVVLPRLQQSYDRRGLHVARRRRVALAGADGRRE